MSAYFARFYFTIPAQLTFNIIFIIAYALHYKKLKALGGILPYAIFALAQCIAGVYLYVSPSSETGEKPLENLMNVLMAVEFVFLYLFLISSIRSRLFRIALKTVMIIFPAAILYSLAFASSLDYAFARLTMIKTYLIVIPCLFYFYEFLIAPAAVNLFKEPRLWMISGILFLFMLLSPVFLQSPVPYIALYEPSGIYALTFIGYSILFIFFITALACQIRIQK
ncbi:MAG: hypothetical protein JNL51_07165 [Chitinophagaceae bacterium]|nr:hypothetical protein [Chitinophagaceae bacterium]